MNIAVIGAGFSGLTIAWHLAKHDCDVEIIEEHDKVGYPKHCTGIISPETRGWLGEPARECELNSYREVRVYGSTRRHYTVKGDPIALIVDRICLEKKILEKAKEHGARIVWKEKILEITEQGKVIDVHRRVKEYDRVVVATGNISEVKLPIRVKRARTIPGINIVLETENSVEKNTLTVGFDHSIAPGFFYWMAPITDDKLVIGAGSNEKISIKKLVEKIAKKHDFMMEKTRILETYGGLINAGPLPKKVGYKNLVFVGDSAGITKPVTGGGLYPIAYVVGKLEGKNCENAVKQVEYLIKKVNKKLQRQYPVAKILHQPKNQKLIDKVVEYFDSSGLAEQLSYKLSFDSHEQLVYTVLKNPGHLIYLSWIGLRHKKLLSLIGSAIEALVG